MNLFHSYFHRIFNFNHAIEGAAKDGNGGGEELEADEAGEIVHQGAAAAALPNSEAGEDRGRVHTIFDALLEFLKKNFWYYSEGLKLK